MILTVICLMDGHAEVSSATSGIRDREESSAVKKNEPEVTILDRKKKKKPKKSKKPGKKKKPNKPKPKPAKPDTTMPTVTTSILKTTTILTIPTMATTATRTTTTVSPTTTATTAKTTISTASATLSTTTSATTTIAITSTESTTTTTTTIPTTGSGGECKATNGKACIFPFKDGKVEYNECKNHGGKYFWCATAVYDSGTYKHWSYCPKDGACPLEGDGECRATNNKPCVFPFKDGKKEYSECADHGGKYFWCATGTNSDGKYTAWSECPKDGSCPLPQKSTMPAMTSTVAAASTTPLTTVTAAATDQMEEKVLDTLENLVLGESRDDSLQMVHMLDKKLDTIIKDLEGGRNKTEQSNSEDIMSESGRLNLTIKRYQDDKIRDGIQLGEGLMFVLSTVDSMKSVSRLSGDCCQDCTSKYPDTQLAEYWETLETCYCYKKMKNVVGTEVEPKTRVSTKFATKSCESKCSATREPTLVCPEEKGYLKRNKDRELYILKEWYDDQNVDPVKCAEMCDDNKEDCKAIVSTKCNKCRLLTELPISSVSIRDYCLRVEFCGNTRVFDCGNTGDYIDHSAALRQRVRISETTVTVSSPAIGRDNCRDSCENDRPRCVAFKFVLASLFGTCTGKCSIYSQYPPAMGTTPVLETDYCLRSYLAVYTIPVGQGDSTVIKCPNDDLSFIDIGLAVSPPQLQQTDYISVLQKVGVTKAGVIPVFKNVFLTHPDYDHYALFNQIIPNNQNIDIFVGLRAQKFMGTITFDNTHHSVYEMFGKLGTPYPDRKCGYSEGNPPVFVPCRRVKIDTSNGGTFTTTYINSPIVELCDTNYEIGFHAHILAANLASDSNKASLVLKINPNNPTNLAPVPIPTMIFMGDFDETKSNENGSYQKLIESYGKAGLEAKWIMLPHHGGVTGSVRLCTFYNFVNPEYVVVSSYILSGHGHPRCVIIDTVAASMRNKAAWHAAAMVFCRNGENSGDSNIYKRNYDNIFQTNVQKNPTNIDVASTQYTDSRVIRTYMTQGDVHEPTVIHVFTRDHHHATNPHDLQFVI